MSAIGETSAETKSGAGGGSRKKEEKKKQAILTSSMIGSRSCIMNGVEKATTRLGEQSARRGGGGGGARKGKKKMNEGGDEFISRLHTFICGIMPSYFQQRRGLITLQSSYRCNTIIHTIPVGGPTNREVPSPRAEPSQAAPS